MMHYHTVGFQVIFCYIGWVDVLYEDQDDMIRLNAGDCVIQPPEIRHRVCHASPEIEVTEIGVPAQHVTSIDRKMMVTRYTDCSLDLELLETSLPGNFQTL